MEGAMQEQGATQSLHDDFMDTLQATVRICNISTRRNALNLSMALHMWQTDFVLISDNKGRYRTESAIVIPEEISWLCLLETIVV